MPAQWVRRRATNLGMMVVLLRMGGGMQADNGLRQHGRPILPHSTVQEYQSEQTASDGDDAALSRRPNARSMQADLDGDDGALEQDRHVHLRERLEALPHPTHLQSDGAQLISRSS